MIERNTIVRGDCLQLMKEIPDNSIDMVLCDLPYSVLNKNNPHAQWDEPIDLNKLWTEYKRICKPNAAIVLFGQGIFSARLILSNPYWYKYSYVWRKGNRVTGFLNAKKQPMRNHEDILVFYKEQPTYNPQMRQGGDYSHSRGTKCGSKNRCYGEYNQNYETKKTTLKFPTTVIDCEPPHKTGEFYHSTMKPVPLLAWLIRTYTNEGDVVLDNCLGSGSTAIAAMRMNRDFIGIEQDKEFFNIAQKRIEAEQQQLKLF